MMNHMGPSAVVRLFKRNFTLGCNVQGDMGNGFRVGVLGLSAVVAACGAVTPDEVSGDEPLVSTTEQVESPQSEAVANSSAVTHLGSGWVSSDLDTYGSNSSMAAVVDDSGSTIIVSSEATHPLVWVDSGDGIAVFDFLPAREISDSPLTAIGVTPQGILVASGSVLPSLWLSDDGSSWTAIESAGLDNWTRSEAIFSSAEATYLAGATLLDVSAGDQARGPVIWRSEDLTTWTRVALETRGLGSVVEIVTNGSMLFAAGNDADGAQIWRSVDGGNTWSRIVSPIFDRAHTAWALTGLAVKDGRLVAVGDVAASAFDREVLILESDDLGESWVRRELTPEISYGLDSAQGISTASGAFWIISNRQMRLDELPERCQGVRGACDTFDPPVLLRSEDGAQWDEIDLAELVPPSVFDFDEVVPNGAGIAVVVTGNDLQVWTWPFAESPGIRHEWPPEEVELRGPVRWDAQLDIGVTYEYPLYIHCGMDFLGSFNGKQWHVDPDIASGGSIDREWSTEQQAILGLVTLVDANTIEYSLPGGEVIAVYSASEIEPPMCM